LILTKNDCPKCDKLKERMKKQNLYDLVFIHNVSEPEGMSVAAFHGVLKENYPILLHGDKQIFGSVISIIKYLKTLGNTKDENK